MSLIANNINDSGELVFRIAGVFDFGTCKECLSTFRQISRAELRRVFFDIEETEELQSCCLGLLRYFHELAQVYHFDLEIRNCRATARELFELAGLEEHIASALEHPTPCPSSTTGA
ncbi:MAG: STAS domain-containing protein [Burkholderiales bacterium]